MPGQVTSTPFFQGTVPLAKKTHFLELFLLFGLVE